MATQKIDTNPNRTRIRKYCDYQERCHSEVRAKLYELKIDRRESEELMVELIQDGRLNEERYARSLARGRFRIKLWGRKKIVAYLRAKGVSDYCIRAGLSEINESEYRSTMQTLLDKKMGASRLKAGSLKHNLLKQQAARYVIARGFESNLVWALLGGNDSVS